MPPPISKGRTGDDYAIGREAFEFGQCRQLDRAGRRHRCGPVSATDGCEHMLTTADVKASRLRTTGGAGGVWVYSNGHHVAIATIATSARCRGAYAASGSGERLEEG